MLREPLEVYYMASKSN